MTTPLVSIVIVNHNGFAITKKCLTSIYRSEQTANIKPQVSDISFEVIVVDNASIDNSIAKLKKSFSQKTNFHVVSRKTNDFLTNAYNEGFDHSRGNIVIFMNNDLTFAPDWLKEIVSPFSQKRVGIVGATILSAKEKNKIDNVGGRLNLMGYGSSMLRGKTYKVGQNSKEPFYIPGMFLAVRRSLFIKAGKFDESYKANYEDVDLAWRIRLLGYKVLIAKKAIIYHLGSWTVDKYLKKPQSSYLCRRNRLTTILKNANIMYLFSVLPLYFLLQLIIFLKELILDKDINLAMTTPRAIYYNFANFESILAKRKKIQKLKKISKRKIVKNKLVKNTK